MGSLIPGGIEIPKSWEALDVAAWHGAVLVVGDVDSGKSTLARYLYARLLEYHARVAFLDADLGQNSFRLPTTVGAALSAAEGAAFPPEGSRRRFFVGSNTPVGNRERLMVGLCRLRSFLRERGADAAVVDTSGFVDPDYGGFYLKWSQVDLFRPCTVVVLHEGKLGRLAAPLRSLDGVRLVELRPASAVRSRTQSERQSYRAACYRDYFAGARRISLPWRDLAIFPDLRFAAGRLAALEDREGFVEALAIVERSGDAKVWLWTPWEGEGLPAALRLGAIRIEEGSFRDQPFKER